MKTLAQPQGCGIGSGQSNGPTDPKQSNHKTPTGKPGIDGRIVWPSPSQDAAAGREIRAGLNASQRLASEVEVIWLDPTAQGLPWLREGFWHRRPTGTAVKAYTAEKREELVFAKGAHRLFRNVAQSMTGVSTVSAFSTVVLGAIGISMMLVGGNSIRAGQMTIGDFVMYLTFTALITVPVVQLANIGTQMTEAFAGLDRIREIRGGELNVSDWGKRQKGEGLFAEQIAALFAATTPPPGLARLAVPPPGTFSLSGEHTTGGGGGGGVLMVFAGAIVIDPTNASGGLRADGGKGANGSNGSGASGNGGGGGGGGGGVLYLCYNSISGVATTLASPTPKISAAGGGFGTKGTGGTGGADGIAGVPGTVLRFNATARLWE